MKYFIYAYTITNKGRIRQPKFAALLKPKKIIIFEVKLPQQELGASFYTMRGAKPRIESLSALHLHPQTGVFGFLVRGEDLSE